MKLDLKGKIKWVTSQWNKPAKGNYVTIKEMAAYSLGGIGVQFIAAVVGYIGMSAGSLLIGSVYGLTPSHMQIIAVVGVLISLLIVPFRGMMMDNTKSKKGKYRPIILWSSIPAAAIAIAMAYIPLTADYNTKFALIMVGFTLVNIFYNQLLYLAYMNLVQVISPNSEERTTIVSVSSIIYSMAPTLTGLFFPVIAELAGGTMIDIKIYRLLFPVFGILGILLTFFAYFGTKERVVQVKTNTEKIPFMEGIKSAFSNKYLWLYNIQQMMLFARNASSLILNWVFIYQLQNGVIMGLLTTLMGTASLIGMVGAPIIVRFIGKRNLNIGSNILFAIAYGLTFFSTGSFYVTFVLIYIANAANSTSIITGPAINADILDYHQWKTGKRMDGFFCNIGIITSVVGMATGFVIPAVTESYGLLTNYDVLYEAGFRGNLVRILAVISFIGGLACCVPMIFYNLSEKKLRVMMRELKQRTLDADLEAGDITQEEYDEKVKELAEQEAEDKAKEEKRKAKKNKNKNVESTEVTVPVDESQVSNTAVPTVDVLEKTALVVGELNTANELAEEKEEIKEELNSDNEGGKQ